MKKILTLLFIFFITQQLKAQDYSSAKEKIYIHTNHVFYNYGDVVYMKFYVVKAADNTASFISKVVYAELISPAGTVVQKSNFKVQDGYAEGSFDFPALAPGGIYKIRAYTTWMQNENDNTFFVKEITLQKVLAPRILMKLDFPEKGYGAGSNVKAEFSMRGLDNTAIKFYDAKYTVSIGGESAIVNTFKTDEQGKAEVIFNLPQDLKTSDGLLNITVAYNGFTESISRSIPIVLNKIDLQFMPEGGTLVAGIQNNIAFKALNQFGKAADTKGDIIDHTGKKITSFESYHFGMGKFLFTPQMGMQYKAVITSPANITQQYDLPFASATGVVMRIEKQNKLKVLLTPGMNMKIKLQGSSKGLVHYEATHFLNKGENVIEVDESKFPPGIAQFTLYAENGMPLAERLVFMNYHRQMKVNITTDKNKYLAREKVQIKVKTTDEEGMAIPSNLSLSVMDDKLWSMADDKQDHIQSWLLLSSELKGKVEEPQFYFKEKEPKAVPALDLLMLTQGYRYFDYIEYVVKENTLKFLPDQENILSGVVTNVEGKPVAATMYCIKNQHNGNAMQIKTNDDGSFFFSGLEPLSYYYLFAQSTNKKEQVKINVLQNGLGYNPMASAKFRTMLSKPVEFDVPVIIEKGVPGAAADIAGRQLLNKQIKEIGLGENRLQEVVVVSASGIRRQEKSLGYAVSQVQAADILNTPNFGAALAGRVAGLQINNNANFFDNSKIVIRGSSSFNSNSQPLLIIDGVPMQPYSLSTLNPNDINNITVLKDATATALYGCLAANGVIMIESKKPRNEALKLKLGNIYHHTTQQVFTPGTAFEPVKKFYAPKYTTTEVEERTDFRETIYWNPVVQTDKNGEATLEFYNSDASTTFRTIAEGIGYNGKLGRTENTYAVQNAIQADVKIPPYLTIGDIAQLPLVIKNNTSSASTFSINVQVPENVKVESFTNEVNIAADSAIQLLIPVTASGEVTGDITFEIKSNTSKEKIRLPISIAQKGFPVRLTFSGNQSTGHNFTIGKMIPGTLQAKLKLFNNLEGQLLDGIESMLREPGGCFEQTSSSTYPNVFILKYLKESGKANKEVEKKALGMIERGYKRLIGFETKENGFEWFGNTPAHEALTAYGLLEFTDMKEFVDVDNKMLERTKKFLLSRRDGKGSFEIKSGGYDRFASVPNKIANVYIVYALTQAGMGGEIKKEYTAAVQKAVETNDAYMLSMMAIAASNMKDAETYNKLMTALEKQGDKLTSETSVTNSRDASLRVETNALYTLALLKNQQPDLVKASTLISKILGEKSYYGYGSTQATVLALNAITQFTKKAGAVNGESPVQFSANEKNVNSETVTSVLHEGNNNFVVNYSNPNKAVPYGFEVSYQTLTPPNSNKAELEINTTLKTTTATVGETVRMDVQVTNLKNNLQPMAIAKVGIPAGLSLQPWQLKELMDKKQVAYYEIFDNYLVLYWMGFAAGETKTISLDVKAEVPGVYTGKASNAYLYYTPEYKHWKEGMSVVVKTK